MEISNIKEEELRQFEDTVIHKKYLLDSCFKLAKVFLENGDTVTALKLMYRASVHDISKFETEEFNLLKKISSDMSCMTNASEKLSELKESAIKVHWKNNSHHPEYWKDHGGVELMDELDIMEMVCDWHSRSCQYGTNLMEFVMVRQTTRFNFPEDMFAKILKYVNLLLAD